MAGLRKSFIPSKLVKLPKCSAILLFGIIINLVNLCLLNILPTTTEKTQATNHERVEEATRTIWPSVSHLNNTSFIQRKNPTTPTSPPKVASNLDVETNILQIFNSSCSHKIQVTKDGIVFLRYITIRSKLGRARVLEAQLEYPNEEDEFFVLEKGFFTLYCHGDVDEVEEKILAADEDYMLIRWKVAFQVSNPLQSLQLGGHQSFQAGHYLAIQRVEFANVYWTIIDLFDIFITTQRLGIQPEKLNIILMDAHPKVSLDPFWTILFQRVIKLTDRIFKESNGVVFENLLWRYPRKKCPLLKRHLKSLKYIQPFRSFVLRQFGISGTRLRKCSQQNLNVLFILRRDYINHPRNLAGIIDRKIANEEDVVREMENSFPNANITTAQLDLLPLKTQLELVATADILFGMHGAAHAFSIFMAPGGAVIEMFNHNSNKKNWHMGKVATLSDHSYITWTNTDTRAVNTVTESTTIPAGVPSRLLRMAIDSICSQSNQLT